MAKAYKTQVGLLLAVLPEVAKEKCFALHGGTAINLFVRDMPRLSVDIDLTYIPIEDRTTSVTNINAALGRIKENLERTLAETRVAHRADILKLQIIGRGAEIKLEVNQINRGVLSEPAIMPLCTKAQEEFDVFCEVPVVSTGQLFGGKICAALDRQHPRDLFDVRYILENEGFGDAVKQGFLFCLLSSSKPIHEVLFPRMQDMRAVLVNQFEGMSDEPFSYEMFESARNRLMESIYSGLTLNDRRFILSVKNLEPDWSRYRFSEFPAIKWKIQNLANLKKNNSGKYQAHCRLLREQLGL